MVLSSMENLPSVSEQIHITDKNSKNSANFEQKLQNVEHDDHYNPVVRQLDIGKLENGSCGFHLSRSKWDPYPWISCIDKESPAEITGLKVGDCVLEVNGEDVLGKRIAEVAHTVRARSDRVSLLLWSTGLEPVCNPESLCCGPMPLNLERLSASMRTIINALECPVCLDTIPPPVIQCQNGHLLCSKCRLRAEKCPICREKYSPGRSLLAEQVYNSLIDAFNLRESADGKLRERLFGPKCAKDRKIIEESDVKPMHSHAHKFLARIMGKSTSVDNLASNKRVSTLSLQGSKNKSLSLSSSEIFRNNLRTPPISNSSSSNRLSAANITNSREAVIGRRTRSCNVSNEVINEISIEVDDDDTNPNQPKLQKSNGGNRTEFVCFCPCGDTCDTKIKVSNLNQHINDVHKVPIISFGTHSAEISLPPKAPVDNACLILSLDHHTFWLKLISNSSNDLFISCLMQSSDDACDNYVLEISIRNASTNGILGKQLIDRNRIFSIQTTSWKNIVENNTGVCYSQETIRAMFADYTELVLKASIKRVDDL